MRRNFATAFQRDGYSVFWPLPRSGEGRRRLPWQGVGDPASARRAHTSAAAPDARRPSGRAGAARPEALNDLDGPRAFLVLCDRQPLAVLRVLWADLRHAGIGARIVGLDGH